MACPPRLIDLAGLFHSIYGTEVYTHASADLAERKTIRHAIRESCQVVEIALANELEQLPDDVVLRSPRYALWFGRWTRRLPFLSIGARAELRQSR